ncbi:hypothetical protein BH23PAT1_BH23PAT1_2430 [soil metagenome]
MNRLKRTVTAAVLVGSAGAGIGGATVELLASTVGDTETRNARIEACALHLGASAMVIDEADLSADCQKVADKLTVRKTRVTVDSPGNDNITSTTSVEYLLPPKEEFLITNTLTAGDVAREQEENAYLRNVTAVAIGAFGCLIGLAYGYESSRQAIPSQ